MTARIVFEGAHLRAAIVGPPPEAATGLMVTFDFRSVGKTDFMPLKTSSNFAKAGYAQLSINTRVNDWFINADTAAMEAELPNLTRRYKIVRALGYSMGGFGAFRFARAVGANVVIGVAPQLSIHPDVVPFEWRYKDEAQGFDPDLGDIASRVPRDLSGLIIFDPFVRPDRRHAERFRALLPGLRFARLGFGGHPPTRVLGHAKRSGLLLKAATADPPSPKPILNAHRAGRRADPGYWTRLAKWAERGHPQWAEHALAEAARLTPEP